MKDKRIGKYVRVSRYDDTSVWDFGTIINIDALGNAVIKVNSVFENHLFFLPSKKWTWRLFGVDYQLEWIRQLVIPMPYNQIVIPLNTSIYFVREIDMLEELNLLNEFSKKQKDGWIEYSKRYD